jgi:hypothetical protein
VAVVPAVPIPVHIRNGQYAISGYVTTGTDGRERGKPRAAPLRVEGGRGDWEAIDTSG